MVLNRLELGGAGTLRFRPSAMCKRPDRAHRVNIARHADRAPYSLPLRHAVAGSHIRRPAALQLVLGIGRLAYTPKPIEGLPPPVAVQVEERK